MVCLFQQGGERMEYKRGAMEKVIEKDGTPAKALQ